MRVLVEDGRATLTLVDRWGATPLDIGLRVGAQQVCDYLASHMDPLAVDKSKRRFKQVSHQDTSRAEPGKYYDISSAIVCPCCCKHHIWR